VIHINDSNLLDKICEVEGEQFRRQEILRKEQNEAFGYGMEHTLADALRAWAEREPDDDLFGYVIYGLGGWNRYFVRPTGEVRFSARHSNGSGVDRAIAAGFEVST
jgi:hypothetical protein